MKKNILLLLITLISIFNSKTLTAQEWKWAVGSRCINGVIESWPIAVDQSGNVYESGVVGSDSFGYSYDSVKCFFGSDSIFSGETILVSTDSNGNYRWELTGKGCEIESMVTDANNNLYIFGSFGDPRIMTIDTVSLSTTSGSWAGFCAKINSSGSLIWLKKIADSSYCWGGGVDVHGNVYISNSFYGRYTTIGTTTLSNASLYGNEDVAITKLDSLGNPLWSKSFGGDSSEFASSMSVTPTGEVYICGRYNSSSFNIGSDVLTFPHGLNPYFFVAKYDTYGTPVWGRSIVSLAYNQLNNIAVDVWGNVYLTGFGGSMVFDHDSINIAGLFLAKYDQSGNIRWVTTDGYGGAFSGAFSIAPDVCGNVWINGGVALTGGTDSLYIINIDSSGYIKDTIYLASGGDDQSGVVVDNKGNLYVGADYSANYFVDSSFIIGPDTLKLRDGTLESLFIAKYSYPMCALPLSLGVDSVTTSHNIGITLYPNPATNECTITSETPLNRIDIFDVTGRLMQSNNLSGNTVSVDISHLMPSIYVCTIYTDSHMQETKKLMIMK